MVSLCGLWNWACWHPNGVWGQVLPRLPLNFLKTHMIGAKSIHYRRRKNIGKTMKRKKNSDWQSRCDNWRNLGKVGGDNALSETIIIYHCAIFWARVKIKITSLAGLQPCSPHGWPSSHGWSTLGPRGPRSPCRKRWPARPGRWTPCEPICPGSAKTEAGWQRFWC